MSRISKEKQLIEKIDELKKDIQSAKSSYEKGGGGGDNGEGDGGGDEGDDGENKDAKGEAPTLYASPVAWAEKMGTKMKEGDPTAIGGAVLVGGTGAYALYKMYN